MLNKNNTRELAYLTIVDNVTPIPGYDRVELAHVGGWTVVVGKGDFKPGDIAIYFEIDSQLPEKEPFINMDFLVKKKLKVKTQKMCKSTSQGLLMSIENFGWISIIDNEGKRAIADPLTKKRHYPDDESRFLTEILGVTYATSQDNARKAPSADKYKKMAQRNGKLFSHQPFRWLMKRDWGKKLLFLFFGRKKDKKSAWPDWVHKTDEERIENLPYLFNEKTHWIATEKIDGSSTTFSIKRGKGFRKNQFYVCSRNVVMDKPDKPCFYDNNIYLEMAKKYHMEEVLTKMLNKYPEADWITIQGETYGAGVQRRDYSMKDHDFKAFNLIMSHTGRWNSEHMKEELENFYHIPCVPILDLDYTLPATLDELREYVDSEPSKIDNQMREGIVFRSLDGVRSFKCVSPNYLIKYHG